MRKNRRWEEEDWEEGGRRKDGKGNIDGEEEGRVRRGR